MEKLEKLVPFLAYIFGKEGVEDWKKKFTIVLVCEACFFFAAVADVFLGGKVHLLGIHPRSFPGGLVGVLFAPFLHSDFTQFLVNAIPFFVLSGFVLMREDGMTTWYFLSAMEVLVGGLCVWTFGRAEADHNGCSGLIVAYFGFLIVFGLVRREARAALIAVITVIIYGGLVWTTLPGRDQKISWEGHLVALCVGAMFGSWEADIVQLKAAGVGSAGNSKESGNSSEKAPLTSSDLAHDDDLHDSEVGAGGVSGAKSQG